MSETIVSTGTHGIMWAGPICQTCGARYLGSHACSQDDILRRVNELLGLLNRPGPARNGRVNPDLTSGCPCRPENGGSGVCGCILSGPTITC